MLYLLLVGVFGFALLVLALRFACGVRAVALIAICFTSLRSCD